MPHKDDEGMKEIMKEAIKEWLDEQFSKFGKWTLGALFSAIFVGVVKVVFAWWYLSGKH